MADEGTSSLIAQREIRLEKVNKLKKLGIDPYPAKSARTHTAKEVVDNFGKLEGKEVTVDGRLMSWREHGHIAFGNLHDQSGKIQLYIKDDVLAALDKKAQTIGYSELDLVDVGDFVQAAGKVTKTESGEISVLVEKLKVLVKTLRPLPEKWQGMTDKEERFRRRYLDMTVNPDVRQRMERRAEFWQAHRDFLNERGFYEVNIPVLELVPGGGDAVPFTTHMNAIDQDFYLRISHELPLKRLIGGGFEKVYDIGARFRNEGLSDEHLPEHVAMEFYWAYADWKDGMKLIEELFNYVIDRVYKGQKKFKIRGFDIDFSKGWEIIDFNEEMKKHYGIKNIYEVKIDEVKELLKKNNIETARGMNVARGIDALWKKIRITIPGPAFLINHPKYLSPLQKPSLENPNMVERLQPIIAGSELGNGWTEVNDAVDQYDRFIEQQRMRDAGDEEAQWLDIDYVEMLEYGMPPTFGWGHSERLFWFLEDVTAREGVPFPQLKEEYSEVTKEIYPEAFEKDKSGKSASKSKKEQDFSQKMVIVVNKELEGWKLENTVAHISGLLGSRIGKEKFVSTESFELKDTEIPANSQYAIIIMEANPGQFVNLAEKVKETGLDHLIYTKEMVETTDDDKLAGWYKEKTLADVEIYGVGMFGGKEEVDILTKKFSLKK